MRRAPVRAVLLGLSLGVALCACQAWREPAAREALLPQVESRFRVETLASGLHVPWDLAWGPDDHLWFTQRNGVISRLAPESGTLTTVGALEVHESIETGLLGMAFHPDFPAEPWVYFAHSYVSGMAPERVENRVVRLRWDGARLDGREVIFDAIPGHQTHVGSRLVFDEQGFLYVTTGDGRRIHDPQNPAALPGKILRLTAEGAPAPGNLAGPVYSIGHRNPQGLVRHARTGRLYATEHGPSDNDEVNLIEVGGNYGWPRVYGWCDDADTDEDEDDPELCGSGAVREPLHAWTPTVAISGIDVYDVERGAAAWPPSLLVTSLKAQALMRLPLSEDGRRVGPPEILVERSFGRLRDVLVGPDGALYLATSNRDVNGVPGPDDDRILRLTPRQP